MHGPPSQRKVVREMMDVLEGGEATFESKMKMYDAFINRVRGQIQDMEIAWIESSFRRRTIDRFRNFLQPVISDKSLLDFVRHELKQPDYDNLRREISQFRESIEDLKRRGAFDDRPLGAKLDQLAIHLDHHISYLQEAIEEIRLMDTEAKPKDVDLYELLAHIKTDYLTRRGLSRDIQIKIDEKLRGHTVYFDGDHLRLIFNNLLNNALRATEIKAVDAIDQNGSLAEVIQLDMAELKDESVTMRLTDNGCGMPPDILQKLYNERCSTQKGRDDGLGGVIIRKLLDINYGKIRVAQTQQVGQITGTIQLITFPRKAA